MRQLSILLAALTALAGRVDALHLPPGTPIYLSQDLSPPVRRAAQDLQRDWNEVLRRASPITGRLDP